MTKINYDFIKSFLSDKKNIVITTHKTPDGDALGSSLSLYHSLKQKHNVSVIVPNEYPHFLKWLPDNNIVIIYEGNEVASDLIINDADLIFCLDFNKLHRVDKMFEIINNSKAFKIMIDHHEEPDNFCDIIISDSSVCSTAELIYDFLQHIQHPLNQKIAICLYTGIITDTGSLRYPNVTHKTHQIISKLLHFNIHHASIHQNLFDSQHESRFKLLKICLENLELIIDKKAAISFLREQDLIDCHYQKGDTEGFVNMPLSLKNIHISTLFIEFKDGIKISFRSQGEFDVNFFAKKYFNGGGHKNASGGFLNYKDISKALDYFSKALNQFINA